MQFWIAFVAVIALLFGGLRAFAQEKTADKTTQKAACQATCEKSKSAECCASKTLAAQEKGEKSGAACHAQAVASKDGATCSAKSAACQKALAAVPAVKYRVGDKELCCDKMASELAKETKNPIKYVVGDKTYDKQEEALPAYAELLDKHLAEVVRVQYAVGDDCGPCPMTADKVAKEKGGKVEYVLASFRFKDKKAAEKASEDAKAAAEKVALKMVVGTDSYECPMSAQDAATKANKPVEYAVGECKTPCKTTARVELAKAKIQAALAAIEKDAQAGA